MVLIRRLRSAFLEIFKGREQIGSSRSDAPVVSRLAIVPSFHVTTSQKDNGPWPSKKSFGFDGQRCKLGLIAAFFLLATPSSAQQTPPPSGFESAKAAIDPLSNAIAGFLYLLASVWAYLLANPPAAVLLGTLTATMVALFSVHQQRHLTRLRETYSSINNDNWDEDVIKARETLAAIRDKISGNTHKISDYCETTTENIKDRTTLQLIMNDYENIALGVRMNILDETYLFRWMRSSVIQDWETLNPLVNAYRVKFSNPNIYIEFEGLTTEWQKGRSYRTGRKIKPAVRRFRIR